MSYEKTMTIGVAVKDGPPAVQQKSTTKDVIAANSQRLTFEYEPQGEDGKYVYTASQPIDITGVINGFPNGRLGFYTISADRYTFKDCGKDLSGIEFSVPGLGFMKIDGPRVFVNQPGADMTKFHRVEFRVNTEMFDCTKPEHPPITITVTYGIEKHSTSASAPCDSDGAFNGRSRTCHSQQLVGRPTISSEESTMPVTPTYPGVYIEEVPSGVKTIVGVATAITAFVGRAARGPTSEPTRIANFGDFERKFGGIDVNSTLSYAVQQFFLNGGTDAVIVRVANGEDAVKTTIDAGGLVLKASGEGKWGNDIRVRVDYDTRDPDREDLFNLAIHDAGNGSTEEFRNLSVVEDDQRYVGTVLDEESVFVDVEEIPDARPGANDPLDPITDDPFDDDKPQYYYVSAADGTDGTDIRDEDVVGNQGQKTGLFSLEKTDLFNILCIPPLSRKTDVAESTFAAAAKYCIDRRAFLLVDPPTTADTVEEGEKVVNDMRTAIGTDSAKNAGIFFPRLRMPDSKKENRLQAFVPCGAVAGVMSRTDLQRGVWKSPAGIEASLVGVSEFTFTMTDQENGRLNPLGMNCLRNFAVTGNVVWGSRTLVGADRLASEWKYLAVRRFTLFIEESLYRGTQWVVFEPNDEPLWAQIRLNVGAFMQSLFRQGAFQGKSPKEAYFVKCSAETTTQDDINRGIVNIEVGFAPLKPAEFVIIKIQQMAGEIDT